METDLKEKLLDNKDGKNERFSVQFFEDLFQNQNINEGNSLELYKKITLNGFYKGVKSSPQGLKSDDAEDIKERVSKYGTNHRKEKEAQTFMDFVFGALEDPMLRYLLVASLVSTLIGIYQEGLVSGWIEGFSIFLAVFIVVTISSIQNYSKEQQFIKLEKENNKKDVKVTRDGFDTKEISIDDLLVGDILHLNYGDIAPVEELTYLCEKYHAMLVLDDAHGFGVLGRKGRGVLFSSETNKQHSSNIIYMATLGKAAGVFGAFVAASFEVIDTLIQSAKSYIYTTASPPLLSHVLMKSLKLIEHGDRRRKKLIQHIQLLKDKLRNLPWSLLPSSTPIQPLVVGDVKEVMRVSQALKARGILVPAIRPPTVPKETARLRISLSAGHQEADILRLVEELHTIAEAR